MADKVSIWEALGFRKASGVGEAGWGYTLIVAIVSFIYFIPVLMIIFMAIKPQDVALSVPPTLSPTSLFGLIPDAYVFSPTLENFTSVFSRSMTAGGAPEDTGFDRYFFNSIVIATVSVMLALVIGTLAAFGFSRYPLKGNDTMTISYHLIRIANEQNKTSEGAAISYLMLFMVIVLTNLYLYLANRRTQGN